MRAAAQHRREVETEAVDTHLGDPVAQGVQHELGHARMRGMQGVAAAGQVFVAAPVAADQPVVALVVEAAEGQRRAELVALGGVVVDDVQHHLQAGLVQRIHHRAELGRHGRRVVAVGRLRPARVGAEKAQRVVTPVVAQATLGEVGLIDAVLHRQQRQRRHAQALEVRDGCRMRQAGIAAAQRLGHARQKPGEALDMHLVQHSVGRRAAWLMRPCMHDRRRRHPRLQRLGRVVAHIHRARAVRMAKFIAVVLGAPAEVADDLARIGVQQQLVRVEAVALFRRIRAVRPEAVHEPRPDARQEAVPYAVLRTVECVATQLALAFAVEHAQFDARRVLTEHGEVHAAIAGQRTERLVPAGLEIGQMSHGRPTQVGVQIGTKNNVASGGRLIVMDRRRPCAGWACTGRPAAATPLPILLPP
mmetsp:Transcript_21539/g.83730  ORF Transcript_21539/g.83730 Transcript_21539/m.83730 type:complete len:418 (-) Transcript_21539:1647-2900(-)